MHVETGDVRFTSGRGAFQKIERLLFLSEAEVYEREAGESHGPTRAKLFQAFEHVPCAGNIAGKAISLAKSAEDVGKIPCELLPFSQGLDAFAIGALLNQGSSERRPRLVERRV